MGQGLPLRWQLLAGEHRIRDLNDEINKELREKGYWEEITVVSMCPIGAYMCHRGRLGWSGTSGLGQNRGTSTH